MELSPSKNTTEGVADPSNPTDTTTPVVEGSVGASETVSEATVLVAKLEELFKKEDMATMKPEELQKRVETAENELEDKGKELIADANDIRNKIEKMDASAKKKTQKQLDELVAATDDVNQLQSQVSKETRPAEKVELLRKLAKKQTVQIEKQTQLQDAVKAVAGASTWDNNKDRTPGGDDSSSDSSTTVIAIIVVVVVILIVVIAVVVVIKGRNGQDGATRDDNAPVSFENPLYDTASAPPQGGSVTQADSASGYMDVPGAGSGSGLGGSAESGYMDVAPNSGSGGQDSSGYMDVASNPDAMDYDEEDV